jgi:hypothetical protein
MFYRRLPFTNKGATTHFVCTKCLTYKGKVETICVKCNVNDNDTFILLDPGTTLTRLLGVKSVANNLKKNLELKSHSMTEGVAYSSLPLKKYDFTCLLNTDGVPVFKSSCCSLWPILFSINELDYGVKVRNIQTLAVWFGKCKPAVNQILLPSVQLLKNLSEVPLFWRCQSEEVQSRIYFPILSCDSVARPSCQGIGQFNGRFGCSWCLEEGSTIYFKTAAESKVKKNKKNCLNASSHKWIYPPAKSMRQIKRRTKEKSAANQCFC